MSRDRRTVLVTGAAGGLGDATARTLADHGWQVFAADLPDALGRVPPRPGVHVIPMDVTDAASVEEARAAVAASADGLDAVVNFAGILVVGSVAEIDEEQLRRILDVNVLGTFRVNRALLPLLLRRKGRIVNVSSETGVQRAAPFNGPYAISKHAVEAYSDALRRELMLLGIPVIKIQPGPFRTGMVGSIERQFADAAAESQHFAPVIRRVMRRIGAEERKAHDPRELAEVVHRALTDPSPKMAYRVRHDRQRTLLNRLPPTWADALLRRVLQPR